MESDRSLLFFLLSLRVRRVKGFRSDHSSNTHLVFNKKNPATIVCFNQRKCAHLSQLFSFPAVFDGDFIIFAQCLAVDSSPNLTMQGLRSPHNYDWERSSSREVCAGATQPSWGFPRNSIWKTACRKTALPSAGTCRQMARCEGCLTVSKQLLSTRLSPFRYVWRATLGHIVISVEKHSHSQFNKVDMLH